MRQLCGWKRLFDARSEERGQTFTKSNSDSNDHWLGPGVKNTSLHAQHGGTLAEIGYSCRRPHHVYQHVAPFTLIRYKFKMLNAILGAEHGFFWCFTVRIILICGVKWVATTKKSIVQPFQNHLPTLPFHLKKCVCIWWKGHKKVLFDICNSAGRGVCRECDGFQFYSFYTGYFHFVINLLALLELWGITTKCTITWKSVWMPEEFRSI